jgi:hypothetical protein
VRLHELYEQYHDKVQFLSIYIREAHPIDGWWLGRRLTRKLVRTLVPKVSIDHYEPKTIEERRLAAGECDEALEYGIRTYVDEMDNLVNTNYAAWPTRLYLIGLDGRVVYAGGLGPYGLKPKALKDAVDQYLKQISPAG